MNYYVVANNVRYFCKKSIEDMIKDNDDTDGMKDRIRRICYGTEVLSQGLTAKEINVLKKVDYYYRSMRVCCDKMKKDKKYIMNCSKEMYDAIDSIINNAVKNPSSSKRPARVPDNVMLANVPEETSNVLPLCIIYPRGNKP